MPTSIVPTVPKETRYNWLRQPGTDRPTYDCPQCSEPAMQCFRDLPETSLSPERTNSFVCFACGRSWQM